jgi:hypothetical protein
MPPELTGWIPQTGAVGLLLVGMWFVFTGRLVPGRTHQEVRTDRDMYREAAETASKAAAVQSAQVAQLSKSLDGVIGSVERLTASHQETLNVNREALELIRRIAPPVDR